MHGDGISVRRVFYAADFSLLHYHCCLMNQLIEAPIDNDTQSFLSLHESMPDVYQDLSNLAAWMLRGERKSLTFQASDLVHEAFIRLSRSTSGLSLRNRQQLVRVVSENMRRILIEHARKKASLKGGGQHARVPLEIGEAGTVSNGNELEEDILAIDGALRRMAEFYPQGSEIVQLRFFTGLTFEEISVQLEMPRTTVFREWTLARAWLKSYLLTCV